MKARINYMGGAKQQDRMVADKLKSLRSALQASYQAATIVVRNTFTEDGNVEAREFRALINPNKLNMDIDDKILSVPFEDKCLNKSSDVEVIGVKVGDIIEWQETGTHWIVYDQYLQELAYFRGQMRQCEKDPLLIGNNSYYYYLKGPDDKSISWQKSKHFIFNNLSYSIEMYISNTIETNEFFKRFAKINLKVKKPNGELEARPFKVEAVDDLSASGLLAIYLKEDFTNEWIQEETKEELPKDEEESIYAVKIVGPSEVYPYDVVTYTVENLFGGQWILSNKKAAIREKTDTSITLEIVTGKSGEIILSYSVGNTHIDYPITILSF